MQDDSTDPTDASLSDCGHERFERNHYFHGKLMTARDMAAEQTYHVGQRRAHARSVAGSGVAWGLETSIRDDDDAVVVTVTRGYAIDECGRSVVVPEDREKTITDRTKVNATALSVYVRFEACLKESVPVDGAETACEDECAYNRVLEVYDIEVEAADPGETSGLGEGAGTGGATDPPGAETKRVEPVTFPDWNDLASVTETGRETPSPTDDGLATIAESYRGAAPNETGTDEDMRIYLGTFTPGPKDPWIRDDTLPTPYVYSNDMLYAATARHAADFGNPHEVSLTSVGRPEENAADIHVRDDESTQPEVTLKGDESVDVSHDEAQQRVDVSVEECVEELVEERVAPLERYAMEKALKYKGLVFRQASEQFDDPAGATAGAIADLARRAVEARLDPETETVELDVGDGDPEDVDPENYTKLLTEFHTIEQEFRGQVAGQVTTTSYQRLSDALGDLKTALKPADPGLLELGSAQDDVVDAVEWLEPVEDDEPEPEPGDATFTADGGIVEERGDVAEIGIELENTNSATLTVGSSEGGYESTVTVQSAGDDTVTVLMNTYLAGQSAGEESQAFGTRQPSDSAIATLNTSELSSPLASGTYDLTVSVDGPEADVNSLDLQSRSTDALSVSHGPSSGFDSLTDATAVREAIDDGTLSGSGRVDPGETVVAEVEVSGIYGAIASSFGDKTDVDPQGLEDVENGELAELTIEQTGAESPKHLDLWASVGNDTARLFAEPSENLLFLVFDSGEATFSEGGGSTATPSANESYEAAFEVFGNSPLASSNERVTDTFAMSELMVQVPPVTDKTYTGALMELESKQLSADPTYEQIDRATFTGGLTYDTVVEQNPEPGTTVQAGSEVDLVVLTSRKVSDVVTGVGTNYASTLENLGYEYVHELEEANAADLSQEIPTVSEGQIQDWIDQAQQERVATELSLREGTSIDQARDVATAFTETDQTNVAAMNDQQMQDIITQSVQNQVIDQRVSQNFLANSNNLIDVTDGTTLGSDNFPF
jgi:hypothetical protein